MAIPITDNINYTGPKPDFVRQEYRTRADLKNAKDLSLPNMYLAYCIEDGKVYLYKKDNEIDQYTGKFRDLLSDAGTSIQKEVLPAAGSAELGNIYQYVGPNTAIRTQGYFYKCSREEDEYYWEQVPVGQVRKITDNDIDTLFESLNM